MMGPDEIAKINEPEKVHMDPNSQHQIWSLWTWTVTPPLEKRTTLLQFGKSPRKRKILTRPRNFEEIKVNCARFGRKAFGSTGQMNVQHWSNGQYIVKVRTEGHPVHDPAFVTWMNGNWEKFFISGFGKGTQVKLETKLEAGDAQDGKPRDQLIIVPPFHIGVEHP
jgi:hypothetical protein